MELGPSTSKKQVCASDKDFEKILLNWYEEVDSDMSDVEDASDIVSNHETDSEQSADDENYDVTYQPESDDSDENDDIDEVTSPEKRYYYGKNRYKWASVEPKRNVRTPRHNLIVTLPGLKGKARLLGDKVDPVKIWDLLFIEEIINIIVTWTNKKLENVRQTYKDDTRNDLKDTDNVEIRAFLGLLIYTGIFKSNNECIDSLFATDGTGRDIFRSVMSGKRFSVLLACLRFDNPLTRKERLKETKLAPIADIFQSFFDSCKTWFTPGKNICVDEMLIGFRGKCNFRMYIPSKPRKYGVKMMLVTDARNHYAYNAYVYTGKDSDGIGLSDDERKLSKPTQSVIRLVKPLYGTNRNITADNWFSSLELIDELKLNGLTYVGTVRKSKRFIPPEFLANKSRQVDSTLYGFTKNITLISYVPKKNKSVILVSSMHHCCATDTETNKPEIITYYNSTKGGVDAIDEKTTVYSSSRRTRRWPLAIFFKLLDISTVNSFVMYNSYKNNKPLSRYNFMKQLAMELTTPHMRKRFDNPRISVEVRSLIKRILRLDTAVPFQEEEKLDVRKYCYLCPTKLHRKTSYICTNCKNPICLACSRKICKKCDEKYE